MERSYDFNDLVNTTNTLNRLSSVEYGDNGLKFGESIIKWKTFGRLCIHSKRGKVMLI